MRELSRAISETQADPATTQLLRRTLAASAKTFRSHAATEEDGFTADELRVIARMPAYSFPRDHPLAAELLQALRLASVAFGKLMRTGAHESLNEVLATIAQDLRIARRTLSPREALALDTAVSAFRAVTAAPGAVPAQTAQQLCVTPAAAIAEFAVLARTPRVFDQLFLARVAPSPASGDAPQLRSAPDIPVSRAARNSEGQQDERPRGGRGNRPPPKQGGGANSRAPVASN